MSQSASNQILSLAVANIEYYVVLAAYFERVIVTNETAGDVYLATNGSTVAEATGAFGAIVLPGAWRMVGNDPWPAAPASTGCQTSGCCTPSAKAATGRP